MIFQNSFFGTTICLILCCLFDQSNCSLNNKFAYRCKCFWCTFIRSSVPGIETITQTLKLALTDFHQLIGAFNQVYENEFQEHCGPKTPCLSHCGPFFQSVHCLLSSCSKELEAIDQFTATSNTITEVVSKKEQFKESWGGGTMETIYEKINEIKQNYEVFLNSLQK
uniref:Uncharacterized protein n=1 Tax=Pyxicephalus adspersus TaxID=30357 RepID=A0AAV3AHY3_PYXAD|nr:TPA: hypothetical protein GDO54_018233 [Pyxicephalus adspersus]